MSADDKEKKELYDLENELFNKIDMNKIYEGAIWLDKEVKRLSNKKKYDGIQSNPPKWIPDPLKKEFKAVRKFLLGWYGPPDPIQDCPFCKTDNVHLKNGVWSCLDCGATSKVQSKPPAHEKIHEFMLARRNLLGVFKENNAPEFVRADFCPAELFDKIDALNYIYDLSRLGKGNGPKAYLGKGAFDVVRGLVISEKNSKAGKQRRGKKNLLHTAIERLKPTDFSHLLELFEDEEKMLDLYESIKNPIDIRIQEVDRENKVVRYRTRHDQEKDVKFKTLQNTLPRIKK